MPELDYKQMFGAAREELKRLHEQKANIEEHLDNVNGKIEAMNKTYNAIAPLIGEQPIPVVTDGIIPPPPNVDALKAAGISVAARYVLDCAPSDNFTASIVRDVLGKMGWDWSNYANPLSTVHTVLTRLAASDVAQRVVKDGKWVFYSSKRNPPKGETGRFVMGAGSITSIAAQPLPVSDLFKLGVGMAKKEP